MTFSRIFAGLRAAACPVFAFCAMIPVASAQTRTWTTTTPAGDTGNWSDTTKWSDGDVPDSTVENATFGAHANSRSIALDGNYSIGTLTIVPRTSGFSANTFALTGTNTLTLNTGLFIGGGTSVAIAPNLAIAADQTWTTLNETGVATLALNGIVSGSGKITRSANAANSSAGIITFSGANTFSGGFAQTASLNTTRLGSASTVAGGVVTAGPLGTGTVTLNAGTLSSNDGTARTLHNNVVIGGTVNLGNSAQTGALTFSDVGLGTASTFTLGSANAGNVTVLRVGGTNLTFDQVIAEAGGTGQSVNFASTSGTPTVTINRTKSATGSILVGGTALVLANGAANSGALVGVNGSITATGANKFSSGPLISDNTALIAGDTTNYSAIAGGQAAVYNNARVSFATDQTQVALAGLFTADSQLRLGLGSGSASATVTQAYNQSALGNGKAGLVSASTGVITYTGALTAGSDGTYRVGGGLGTLALTNANSLTGANNVIVEGGGTLRVDAAQNYTGTTTLNSALTLQGPAATINGSSALTVNNTTLTFDNTGGDSNATNRFNDSATLTLNRGTLATLNNGIGSPVAVTETFGGLTFGGGANIVSMANAPGTGTKTIQFGTLTRQNNAVALFRGDGFGPNAGSLASRNIIKITGTAPALIGGGGAEGTTNVSILPWARGGSSSTSSGSSFLTYDSGTQALRLLNTTTEFAQASAATNINTAVGANTDRNVRALIASGSATLLSGAATVNSLLVDNSGATGTATYSLGSNTLTVGSGAVAFTFSANQDIVFGTGTLAFGTQEAVVTTAGNGRFFTLNANITGSGGATFFSYNGNLLSLGGISGTGLTGTITVGGSGNGGVGIDQDARFGNAANNVVHAGGTLTYFSSNYTSARNYTLLGGVGNNTFDFQTQGSGQNHTISGNIDGAGTLRRIQSIGGGGTAATNLTLSGNNTYTGGTIIEGSSLTAASNNALGTGTVTLIGANNTAASLSLTGTGVSLGGLRGTDGTVTINPTASIATLTIGSNNENTVFNGVIREGSGKTGSFTKTGTGTLVLGGTNTYTGMTTVAQGRLLLAVNNAIAASSPVALSGGTLASGFNQTLGALNVSAVSILDLGTGGTFSFADSSAQSWTGALSIVGTFTDGASVRFGTTDAGLTSGQLSQITINGFAASINASGYLSATAIPEPSTFAALAGVFVLGLSVLRRRRQPRA
jgi:fibronectin-binding autotransporter adhesin